MHRGTLTTAAIALLAVAALVACGPNGSAELVPCNDDGECRADQRCELGRCMYHGTSRQPTAADDAGSSSSDDAGLSSSDDAGSSSSDDAGSSWEEDAGLPDAGPADAGRVAVCGDGEIDEGEDCDDGNTSDDQNGCSADCLENAVCGNGVVESLYESCDTALHACCADDCRAPASSDTVCRAADASCDAEELCDGTALECPADDIAADDTTCSTCDFGACECEAGVCEATRMRLDPDDLSFFGLDSYYPADPAEGCHEHGNANRDPQVGTWESSEEERAAVEFALPDVSISQATLRFEVQAFEGYDGQTGPGDFEVEIVAYEGNGAVGTSDCFRSTRSTVGSFMTVDLQLQQDMTFDVTAEVLSALDDQLDYVGFRLQPASDPGPHTGIVLDDFDLVLLP